MHEELIDRLTADMKPAPQSAVSRRLATAVTLGAALSLILLWTCMGMRDDMSVAVWTTSFWMKWAFALAGALPAFVLARRLARPDGRVGLLPILLIAPVAVLALVAVSDLLNAPPAARTALWLGESAQACPWIIGALSLPLLVLILAAFRSCAPTRLSLAGFTAGLLAGTAAASVYALCCTETEPAFIVTWYTLGMLLPALVGAALGPRLLRW